MYQTPIEYRRAMDSQLRVTKITGTIYTQAGVSVLSISNENIFKNSVSIQKQCVNGSDLSLGSTYISELNISINYEKPDYQKFNGMIIRLWFSVLDENEEWQTVPLGIFDIIEARRSISCVRIKAYDYMARFDKTFVSPDTQSRTPYDWLTYICSQCSVNNGMTEIAMNAFPNQQAYPIDLTIANTYRDALSLLAKISGCFAFTDRVGSLKFKLFEKPNISPSVLDIPPELRNATEVEDYVVKYVAMTMVKDDNEYGATVGGTGKSINIGTMPLLESFGSERSTYETACSNILTNFSTVIYQPFSVNYAGDPALDCGDWITLTDTQSILGEDVTSIVTHITWYYSGMSKIKGVGTVDDVNEIRSNSVANTTQQILKVKANLKNYAKHLLDGSAEGSLRLNIAAEEDEDYTLGWGAVALGYNAKTFGSHNSVLGGSSNRTLDSVAQSVISGGSNNEIGSDIGYCSYDSISGGNQNRIYQGTDNFIGGGSGNTIGENDVSVFDDHNAITGGQLNRIHRGDSNFIGGGFSNDIGSDDSSWYNFILGGIGNKIFEGTDCGILGGQSNRMYGKYNDQSMNTFCSLILAGSSNDLRATYSIIAGGENNRIYDSYYSFAAGYNNYIYDGRKNFIAGGDNNKVIDCESTLVSGTENKTSLSSYTAVFGGYNKAIKARYSVFGGYGNQIGYYTRFLDATVVRTGNTVNVVLNTAPTEYTYGRKIAFFNGSDLIDVFDLYWQAGNATSNTITLNTTALQNYTDVYEFFPSRYSGVFGYYNIANNDNQLISGKYNQPNKDALFQIGNGTDENIRSNAFEVLQDGTLKAGGQKVPRKFIITLGDDSASDKAENLEILYKFMGSGDYEYDLLWACYFDANDEPIFVPLTACHLFRSNDIYVFSHYDVDNTKWCTYKVTMNADYTDYTETYIEH